MYLPLIRRAVQMDTARGPAGVSLGLATAWIAASVALCSLSVGALCITSFVFASILSATNIAGYRGGTGGSVSERGYLEFATTPIGTLQSNNTDLNSVESAFEGHVNDLILIGNYDFNFIRNGSLFRRGLEISRPVIHFTSKYGEHVAIHTSEISHEEFGQIIANATPDHPHNGKLGKRGWSFDATWVSYNYDNVNSDLARQWADNIHNDNQYQLEEEMLNFMSANDGYKYCISPVLSSNPGDISKNAFDDSVDQTPMHGETYFNTYGGIDGECNDYYDCLTSDCSGF